MEAIERIRAKIGELESKLADLRIVERELLALEAGPAPTPRAPQERKPRVTRAKAKRAQPAEGAPRQTIGAAIATALEDKGALSVAEIAEEIEKTGRSIDKRSVSYSLQAMKKQGRVKSEDGKWLLLKSRSKAARA